MKQKILTMAKHPLISGSTIVFFGSLFGNLFNFLFNFAMTRYLLSTSDYGILASLISLFTLSSQPVGAVIPMLVYFSASYFAKGDFDRVRGLFLKITKPSLALGTLIFVLYTLFSRQIAQFLNIEDVSLIILVALMVYLGFVGVANQPFLQAKLSFSFIAFSTSLGAFVKFALGVLFVILGFSIGGAMWAVFIGTITPYILSFIPLRFLLQRGANVPHISYKSLFTYGAPAALASLGLNSLINTDIILVKHFFHAEVAGLYATLSLVGKVIFFFSAPIGMVMFPLVTQKYARDENYHNVFRLSLLLVFLSSIIITVFYFFSPEFIIKIFSKNPSVLTFAPYLGLFGIFITIYSVLTVLNNFYLSINRTKIFIPILLAAFLQLVFIWFFHASVLQIILISLTVASLLLILLLVYYWILYDRQKRK